MKKKLSLLMTLLLCAVMGAWADTETPGNAGSKDTDLVGTSYTISGTFVAGQGSGMVTPMTTKGVKVRLNKPYGDLSNVLVISINEGYQIDDLTIYAITNSNGSATSVASITVDGKDLNITPIAIPAKDASEAGTITLQGISAKESIVLKFGDLNGVSQGNFDFHFTYSVAAGGDEPAPEPVAEKTIYLNPAIWDVDEANERYAVYAFDDVHSTNAWFDFASVNDGQGTYAATITGSYTGIILARMNGETTENSFDNAWNQTEDITYSNVEDNTLFTIASWDGGANRKSTWTTSTYTAPVEQQEFTVTFTTDAGWDEVYAWTWTGDTNHEGTWPGKKLTAVDGVYTYTYKGDAAPEKILFNGGDDTKKTSDMAFVDGKAYKWITATPLFAIQAGVTYTYGQTVEVKDADDEVVATITFGNEGGETGVAFNATVAQTIEGYTGYVAQTSGGNGTNGNKTGGTTYTIKPNYDGQLSIAVKVGGGKVFHLLEDGVAVTPDDGSLDGFTPAETFFGTIDFAVTAGRAYKFYCDGSKLDIFGFDYKFTKPEPVPEPEQIIPNGAYYVMNANAGTLVNAEGATDAKGAPMTFTYNAETETFTIAGADFFADKQWTVANQYSDMPGYFLITTVVDEATKYLTVDAEGNLTLADAADENATWIILQQAYWEDIMKSTYTIAGTKNLTGTDNDWDVVEANQMKYNEESKLFEITYKGITVTNDVKPEFKVVKTPMEGADIWYPEGDNSNWVITPDYLGGEGEYDITITFDPSDSKEIGVTGLKIEDINITVEDGADIFEALIAAEMGKSPRNISINLVENGSYTITGPLTAYGKFEIQGNGATIDASGLGYNLIQMVSNDETAWDKIEYVSIHNATIKGLKKPVFYSGYKNYDINWLTIDNSVIELAADVVSVDFTKGSVARNFNIENSTIYAPTATTKSFYSSQSAQRLTDITGVDSNTDKQSFIIKNSTMYNLAPTKNFFTHRQNSQKWLAYTVENSLFVNCGKNGQVIKGLNGGGSSANPVWTVSGNAFNYDGADTSAAESTGDDAEPIQNSVAGVVTFTDAAAGDFNGEFQLAEGATAPESLGDGRWNLTFKAAAPAGIELANIAVLKNFSTDVMGAVAAVLTLTDAKVTFVTTKESPDYDDDWNPITVLKDYVLIEDASAGYLLEGSGLGSYVKAGDVLNGKLAISLIDNYGWGIYQATLTNGTQGVTITEDEVSPIVVTDENVSSYIEDNDFRLAQFNNVVINVSDGQVSFTAAVMGENEIDINDQYSIFSETIANGAKGTLTGYMANLYGQAFFVPTAFEPTAFEPDYYLVGTFNNWTASDTYKFTLNENASEGVVEYMLTLDIPANSSMKVLDNIGNWYPATGPDFVVNDEGNFTVYFRPNADGDEFWFEGCIYCQYNGVPTGISTVKADNLKDAQIFNLAGQRIQSAQKGLYIVNGKKVVIK